MVGHTGDIEATVVACKAADEAVKVYGAFAFLYILSWASIEHISELISCQTHLKGIHVSIW